MPNMSYTFERLFRAPYAVPNGVALAPEGLWIADQISDQVALVDMQNPNDYGVTRVFRSISSESSNTSGMCCAHGSLWLAANGAANLWRPARGTDARTGTGEVLQVDARTGETQARYPIPGGGGTHGIEMDVRDPGCIWLSTLKQQTLSKVRIKDWSIVHTLPLAHDRSHGIICTESALWIVYTNQRQIAALDMDTGACLHTVQLPADMPEPHGLTREGAHMVYCDATTGWIVRIRDVLAD